MPEPQFGPPPAAASVPVGGPPPAPTVVAKPASWQDLISAEAKKQGIDPRLALAVADTESSFNPGAVSPKGASGLMQLMPETAKRWGVDPADPVQNIRGGVSELKSLLDQHQGDVVMALRRYNASAQADPSVTEPYVQKVLGRLKGSSGAQPAAAPTPMASHEPVPEGWVVGTPPPTISRTRPGTPPPPPPSTFEQQPGLLRSMAESFDPRTSTGRRNLAGGAGGLAATAAVVGSAPVSLPVAAGAAILGAAGGGMLAESGEQIVGTKPPSGPAALGAGAEQAAYETVGQGVLWPVRALASRAIASRVGRYATEGLSAVKAATVAQLQSALDATQQLLRGTRSKVASQVAGARATSRGAVAGAEDLAREGVRSAKGLTASQVGTAETLGAEGVAGAETSAAAGEAAARAPYESLVGQRPPSASAGRQVVHQAYGEGGGAKASRDAAGAAVEQAAASGPAISKVPILAELERLSEQITPMASHEATGPVVIGGREFSREQASRMLPQDALNAATLPPDHPLPAILAKVQGFLADAGDTISFADAHKIKRLVDDAINWAGPAKKQAGQITKRFRTTLRDLMSGHAPYDQATAHYSKIAPLYTQGIAPKIRKLATEEPEAIVRLISPKQPTKVQMLQDLLTRQAAEGGDAAGGQAAWDAVRGAWTHEKVIQGGLEGLGKRLDAVQAHPDFHGTLFGDESGKRVWANLRAIQTAFDQALAKGEAGVVAAKEAGKGGVEAMQSLGAQRVAASRDLGRMGVEGVREVGAQHVERTAARGRQAVESATGQVQGAREAMATGKGALAAKEAEFEASSLGKKGTPGTDVLRALALGPRFYGGAISIARLLHGPTANDLVQWAAFSPAGTRAFVKAITSPAPAVALADLVRSSGVLGELQEVATPVASHPQVGQPPPR